MKLNELLKKLQKINKNNWKKEVDELIKLIKFKQLANIIKMNKKAKAKFHKNAAAQALAKKQIQDGIKLGLIYKKNGQTYLNKKWKKK